MVSARIVMAAARGILLSCDRSQLGEFGGHVEVSRHWAYSLLNRMKFRKRKVTTAKSKHSIFNFTELKETFLNDVVATVEMKEIPPELILNWDQTRIKIVPSNTWTMDQQGSKWVEATTSGPSQPSFVAHLWAIFRQSKSVTKAKQVVAEEETHINALEIKEKFAPAQKNEVQLKLWQTAKNPGRWCQNPTMK